MSEMEKYISVVETAERWNVSPRRIQILCNENRIKGAKKQSGIWFIPYGAKKPERIKSGVKNEENKVLNVLSLFSGCGGMDLGFEGGFDVLAKSVNMHMHKDWKIKKSKDGWVRLPKINFIQYLLMILNQRQKQAWSNYFGKRGLETSSYYLDSIVDLVKLQKENKINIFPEGIDIVNRGIPLSGFLGFRGKEWGLIRTKGIMVKK